MDVAEAAYASNFVWEVTYNGATYDFATLGDYFDWMTTVVAADQKDAYSDAMQRELAALFGVDPSQLTPLGLRGGNANFRIGQDVWNTINSRMNCSDPGTFGIRCDDGIHLSDQVNNFQYGQGVLWVHMDSANPYSGIGGSYRTLAWMLSWVTGFGTAEFPIETRVETSGTRGMPLLWCLRSRAERFHRFPRPGLDGGPAPVWLPAP